MTSRLRYILLFLLCLVLLFTSVSPSMAQSPAFSYASTVRFDRLTVEDGLSNATVLAALQDREGFMWFATGDGLDRYDGNTMTVFRYDETNPYSISGNSIYALLETKDGTLWIGTDPGGLNRYNRETSRFTAFKNDKTNPASLSDNGVWSLFEDSRGTLWVGTRNGLNAMDRTNGTFKAYLAGNIIYRIIEDRSGMLWVGTREGLFRLDPATGETQQYRNDPDDPNSLSSNRVWGLCIDSRGVFWVATRGGGINRFDPKTEKFAAYQNNPDDPNSLSDNNTWNIYEDRSGTLWVATERGGLNRFEREQETFVDYQHNPNDPFSLSHNDVYGLFEDRSGVLWITSRRGGVNRLYPALQRFNYYRHIPEVTSLKVNNIGGIWESPDGLLWVGTVGGGLNRINRQTGEVKTYLNDAKNPVSISGNDIYTLYQDAGGMLWIGLQGAGLSRLDPETEQFTSFKTRLDNPKSIASNYITAILSAGDGQLWLGTLGYGLDLFDPVASEAVNFKHDASNTNSLGEDTIYNLAADPSGKIWIATGRAGADLFDPQTKTFTHYTHDASNTQTIIDNTVNAIYPAKDAVWMGTSGGLSRLNRTSGLFRNYTLKDGLPNNTIYGILPDDQGNIWLSTGKGLSRFDPKTGTFRNFDPIDGLQSNQFNLFSYHRGPTGELFFGGPNGLNSFFPAAVQDNSYLPQVIFTGFQLFNQPVNPGSPELPRSLNQLESLTLRYDQSVFTFEFASDNYQAGRKNLFQYKMEGFDKDWSPPSTRRQAFYTNLDPGVYTFMVRAANNDGLWNNAQPRTLKLTIEPPWWRTSWFYGLMIISAILLVFFAVQARINGVQRRNRELEQHVFERTSELRSTNQQLRDEIELREKIQHQLETANARLQNQIEEITALRDDLRELAVRDVLTGLYNRRYLEEQLALDVIKSQQSGQPISVLMLDIDHFKAFNDTHGHKAGDVVLQTLGRLLSTQVRQSDVACRYGGEEFVIIMPNTHLEDAHHRAEGLRHAFEKSRIQHETTTLSATLSIGVATYPDHGLSYEELLDHADHALYQAKASGRNCVMTYKPEA